jgi:hypothetical protein
MNGDGFLNFSDGLCIFAQFKDNLLKDTYLQAIYLNGDIYCGAHVSGHKIGKGTYIYSSLGLTYKGDWLDNKRHGKGELIGPGTLASGTFQDDHLLIGEYSDEHGSIYRSKKDPK